MTGPDATAGTGKAAPDATAGLSGPSGRRSRGSWVVAAPGLALPALLALAAAVFAAWAAWSWLSAPRAPAAASVRDQALRAGEQAVLNFNTLDYRHLAQGVALWEQSSTGALHAEIVAGRAAFEQQVAQAKTVTTARILDGALTGLDVAAGRADVIVAVQITVTPAHGAAAVKQSRLTGQLTRTAAGWKLSALSQVPVGAAAAGSRSAG
jgi:Mce-associated membrane protein